VVSLIIGLALEWDVLCYLLAGQGGVRVGIMDEFVCPGCDSPALSYPEVLHDDEPVVCACCGAFVSSYGELKQRTECVPNSNSIRVSGC
jgi:hypothetical protein